MLRAHRLIALTLLILVTAIQSPASPESKWSVSFEKDVKWMRLMQTGHLVAGTDEGLVGIDPETGAIAWKMEELDGLKEDRFEVIPYTQLAVVQVGKGMFGAHNKMVVIDYVNGQEKWNSDKHDILSSMGQFILPELNALFILGRNAKGKEWVRVTDLETGDLLWEGKDFFKKRDPQIFQLSASKQTIVGNQEPLFDTDETMITFMNKKAIRKWNANTGELIWENEVKCKAAPAVQWGFCRMFLNEDASIVYAAADKTVHAVRTSDGTSVWEKAPKLEGMVYQMRMCPEGLLVKGGPDQKGENGKRFISLIDLETGKKVWKDDFKKLKASTNFLLDGERLLVFSDKKLYAVNLADGKYEEIAKDLKFKHDETPSRLWKRDDALYMSSAQNMMLLSMEGDVMYHTHYKAPGGSLLGKIATTAVIAAVNIGTTMNAMHSAQHEASQSVTGRGSAKYKLMTNNPYMALRYKASKGSHDYRYILTKVETDDDDGPGLVKVDKSNGKTVDKIILGTKEPIYEIDKITSALYFVDDKRMITAFDF